LPTGQIMESTAGLDDTQTGQLYGNTRNVVENLD